MAFPGEHLRENPNTRLEDLKEAPRRLRKFTWGAAVEAATQAFALVKSHYPRVDLHRFEEGYAADADEDKIDTLTSEAQPIVELLIGDIRIAREPLPRE